MNIAKCPFCYREHKVYAHTGTITCSCGNILKQLNRPKICPDCTKPEEPLLAQRHSTHGRFEDNAEITDQIMYILQTSPGWHDAPAMVRVAAFMIVHKLARALSGSVLFDDHWKDIAGYATLIVNSIK